jgi:hypothetical protein
LAVISIGGGNRGRGKKRNSLEYSRLLSMENKLFIYIAIK